MIFPKYLLMEGEPASGGGAPADWTSGLSEETRGYVQTKGFKDPGAVVESYRNYEKLMGVPQDRLLKLPEKADAPEWGSIYEKLGRPKDAAGYDNLKFEGAEGDFFKNLFFESGLSKTQAEKIVSKFGEFNANAEKTKLESISQTSLQQQDSLKKEWGAAYEQNIGVAKKFATAFGLDGSAIDKLESALGFDGLMKLAHNIGSKIGEDSFVTGKSAMGIPSPEAAKAKIQQMYQDKDFVNRYAKGDVLAREEMDKLHKWAYPEA